MQEETPFLNHLKYQEEGTMNSVTITDFQKKIRYEYSDRSLLETALTHSSFANEHQLKNFRIMNAWSFLVTQYWNWCPVMFCLRAIRKSLKGH